MVKAVLISLSFLFTFSAYAKINVMVSIAPQRFFVQKIAGPMADVSVILPSGANMDSYTLSPKQTAALAQADIYFTIGDPAERGWLSKINSGKMLIVDTDTGIQKLDSGDTPAQSSDSDDEPDSGKDPHIWLDPVLVIKQTKAIADALIYFDKANAHIYTANYKKFTSELTALNRNLNLILKNAEVRKFLVFHPAWSYFAKRYNLQQVSAGLNGKMPGQQDVFQLIKTIKEQGFRVVFAQPLISLKDVKQIVQETGARVMVIDPLAENWAEYLTKTAMIIAD